jgi:hypothetical protein
MGLNLGPNVGLAESQAQMNPLTPYILAPTRHGAAGLISMCPGHFNWARNPRPAAVTEHEVQFDNRQPRPARAPTGQGVYLQRTTLSGSDIT